MRAVIQRVIQASVSVDAEVVSEIGKGICVLVGITNDDTQEDVEYIVNRILNTRVFEDAENGKMWAKSVSAREMEILSVSQFTLYGKLKGNKPDFHMAMGADRSKEFYDKFLDQLKSKYNPEKIKDGVFGADMKVNIVNDGPVTIILDSNSRYPGMVLFVGFFGMHMAL